MAFGSIKYFFLLLLIRVNQSDTHNVLDVQDQSRASDTKIKVTKDDALCKRQAGLLVAAYQEQKIWALKVFDSWGKSQSGMFSGNHINFGHYEQCLQIREKFDNESDGTFQGQHCIIFFRDAAEAANVTANAFDFVLPQNIHIEMMREYLNFFKARIGTSMCLPSFCTGEMVQLLADKTLASNNMITTRDYDQDSFCNTININEMRPIDMFAALFFSFMLLLLTVSTAYDLTMRKNKRKQKPIFAVFSVYTNGLKLFEINEAASRDQIDCIHGIRAISILQIIHGHRIQTYVNFPIINKTQFREQWFSSWSATIPLSSSMAINTFFLLSGLLTTKSILKKLEGKQGMNVGYLYLHRYLRITPVVGATIFCFMSLQRYFGDGPFNKFLIDMYYSNCEKYWFTALLHVQNIVNPHETCMGHTWYLSPDFQLFMLAPLLVYPLWRFGKYFTTFLAFLCMASVGFIFFICNKHGFHVLPYYNTLPNLHLYNQHVYTPFYTRVCPYLLGMMTAYVLFKMQGNPMKIPKHLSSCLWITSISVILAIILGMKSFQIKNSPPPKIFHSIYTAGSQLGWSVALAWIILACHCEGGLINRFLSHNLWKPLSRIGLSIYVTHILAILAIFGTQKQPAYFNDFLATHLFIGDLGLSFGVAVLAFLTFEASFLAIEGSFLQQKKRK